MSHAQRLRDLAARTGLDGFGDELRAMADEMEAEAPSVGSLNTREQVFQSGHRIGFKAGQQAALRPAAQPVGEPIKPFFAVSIASRKWAELQEQGHRMQHVAFDGGPDGAGVIDPWGKVTWGSHPVPAGYLMHWPAPGGGRDVLWSETGAEGRAIGCPVEPVFKMADGKLAAVILPEHADHVAEIAARLRHVAQLAGCADAVPQDDEIAVGAIFSVLGNMRFKLERLPSRLQPAAVLDALAIFERLTGRDDDPVEARQAYDTLRLALVKQEGAQP